MASDAEDQICTRRRSRSPPRGLRFKEKKKAETNLECYDRGSRIDRDRNDGFAGRKREATPPVDSETPRTETAKKKESQAKKKKRVKDTPTLTSSEPMIIVYVNDRLGTKAGIPCLASDSISEFY